MLLGVQANSLFVVHQGQTGGRGLSPRLWGKVLGGQGLSPDGLSNGYSFADDFMNFGAVAPAVSGATEGVTGGYGYYVDTATTANSITQVADAVGGVIRLASTATDNHETWLTSGGNTGVLGVISDTAGADKLLIFEARVRFTQVGNTYNAFVGLSEEALADNDTVTDAGALASKDLIGFSVLEADGDALNFVYRKAGQTAQTAIAGVQALTAATWYKVGFVYDPTALTANRIRVFVDNVEHATKVTGTNIAAATFPDGEELAFLAGVKNGTASANSIDIDWWAFYQQAS